MTRTGIHLLVKVSRKIEKKNPTLDFLLCQMPIGVFFYMDFKFDRFRLYIG